MGLTSVGCIFGCHITQPCFTKCFYNSIRPYQLLSSVMNIRKNKSDECDPLFFVCVIIINISSEVHLLVLSNSESKALIYHIVQTLMQNKQPHLTDYWFADCTVNSIWWLWRSLVIVQNASAGGFKPSNSKRAVNPYKVDLWFMFLPTNFLSRWCCNIYKLQFFFNLMYVCWHIIWAWKLLHKRSIIYVYERVLGILQQNIKKMNRN